MEQMVYVGNKIEAATTSAIADALVKVLNTLHDVHASETIQAKTLDLLRDSFASPSNLTFEGCHFDSSSKKDVTINTEAE